MPTYPLTTQFQNRYGRLEVEPVTPLLQVRNIRGVDYPDDIKFDLETAERIVLITENRRSQIAFQEWTQNGRAYMIVHTSPSEGYIVRIVSLDYTGPNAQEEIERLRPRAIMV